LKKTIVLYFSLMLTLSIQTDCQRQGQEPYWTLDNKKIQLSFDRKNGALRIFRDQSLAHHYIDPTINPGSPWQIDVFGSSASETIDIHDAAKLTGEKSDPLHLTLTWSDFPHAHKDLRVNVTIALDNNQPLSYWKISLQGIKGTQINQVVFPRIAGITDLGNEKLAVPQWMGQILENPRTHLADASGNAKKFEWTYPGLFSMQCLALYNPDRCGLYASCDDSSAFIKNFSLSLDTLGSLIYQMHNYPALDSTQAFFAPPYCGLIGSFQGDWITAAEWYRSWATKQRWCRESRFKNQRTPSWLEDTALWIWNRSQSAQVLVPALDLQQRLGLPVSVFWHWWHGCSYDHGFPEYLPPRQGRSSFISALTRAQQQGLHAIVYMNQVLWGTATPSWKNERADLYAAKNLTGEIKSHVFNIFTQQPLAYMCMGTRFWRDKYSSLCDSVVNRYHTNGVYMDMACLSLKCYDPNHGHPMGGGHYWVENFAKLTEQIRGQISSTHQPILAGEGCGEAWLPHLDLFLTLAVSKERYAGPGLWETIPFFQAVYHPYGITYGNYSSLLVPPYDELWPKEFAPKQPRKLLEEEFNRQFLMEQARSFVWGLQPTIANYQPFLATERKEEIQYLFNLAKTRNQALKYLLHGKFVRGPVIQAPEQEMAISRLSIYAGKKGESVTRFRKRYPLIYSATWQADDHDIGIALASISDDPFNVVCDLNSDDYGLPPSGSMAVIDQGGKKWLGHYADKKIHLNLTLKPKALCLVELTATSAATN